MRLTEGIFSLGDEYQDDFSKYERGIDRMIHNYQIIALCTYPLKEYNAPQIIDVITDHQFALVKREGTWEKIKSSR